jgi:hypothetical protein
MVVGGQHLSGIKLVDQIGSTPATRSRSTGEEHRYQVAVQSWYPYPKQMVPETAPHTMTALVKAVIQQVRSGEASGTETSPSAQRQATTGSGRIALQPQPGAMQVTARAPGLDNQVFALGIPETIGCREAMLVNFPEARIEWQGPAADGVLSCSWGPGGRISYSPTRKAQILCERVAGRTGGAVLRSARNGGGRIGASGRSCVERITPLIEATLDHLPARDSRWWSCSPAYPRRNNWTWSSVGARSATAIRGAIHQVGHRRSPPEPGTGTAATTQPNTRPALRWR